MVNIKALLVLALLVDPLSVARAEERTEVLTARYRRFVADYQDIQIRCTEPVAQLGGLMSTSEVVVTVKGKAYSLGRFLSSQCAGAVESLEAQKRVGGPAGRALVVMGGKSAGPEIIPLNRALKCELVSSEQPVTIEGRGCAEPTTIMRVACGQLEVTVACSGKSTDPTACFHEQIDTQDLGLGNKVAPRGVQ